LDPLPKITAHYEILAEVGKSRTGIVYEAREKRSNRTFALKVLRREEDPKADARLFREARVMASLENPNVPAVCSVDEADGCCYLVRAFVRGKTLEAEVRCGELSLLEGIAVVAAIAWAVQRIHDRGIVHRNIDALTVLVSTEGAAWQVGFSQARGMVDRISKADEAPLKDVQALQGLVKWLSLATNEPLTGPFADACGARFETAAAFARLLTDFIASFAPDLLTRHAVQPILSPPPPPPPPKLVRGHVVAPRVGLFQRLRSWLHGS
jgi:serine/threonine protein kinase